MGENADKLDSLKKQEELYERRPYLKICHRYYSRNKYF